MQGFQQLFNLLLKDIQNILDDEFDRNFERKAFFTTAWKTALRNNTGSLMYRTGALAKSITPSQLIGNTIRWESSLPYADLHNSGGKIMVTQKMKNFFWYKFKMATGGDNKNLNTEALFWKAMALKKVGTIITIEKRQFIGEHPVVHQCVQEATDNWFQNDLKPFIDQNLNNIIR